MALAGRRDLASVAGSVLLAASLAGAAAVAMGRPDTSAATEFLSTARPTHDQALATIQIVVWVLIAGLVIVHLVSAFARSAEMANRVRQRRARARVALALGLLVFGGGVVHHQTSAGTICCGDVARAERLVH